MHNKAMQQKLINGECIDVNAVLASPAEQEADGSYTYHLKSFQEDVDYCDALRERWVWSIGKRVSDGAIIASTDTRYYHNDLFLCLFLR